MSQQSLLRTAVSVLMVTMLAMSGIGQANTFLGLEAGAGNTTGTENSFFGSYAGRYNSTGVRNTFFGVRAGENVTTGGNNVFVGYGTGFPIMYGSNNTSIGANARHDTVDMNYATAIGAGSFVTTSNTVQLGRSLDTVKVPGTLFVSGSSILNGTFVVADSSISIFTGTVSVNTLGSAGSTSLCRNSSYKISTCSSSLRYKTNFANFSLGLDLINRLRPITFDWKDGGMHDLGLGAEDVAAIEPLLVTYNDNGEVEGVKYDRIGVVLINAIKEQQTQIGELKAIVCELKPTAKVCRKLGDR